MYKLETTTHEIQKFRSRETAQDWLRFQRQNGNDLNGAMIRMRKYPDHKWANRVGNVATIKTKQGPLGDYFLFTDGVERPEFYDNKTDIK